jgi:hypothetical protein
VPRRDAAAGGAAAGAAGAGHAGAEATQSGAGGGQPDGGAASNGCGWNCDTGSPLTRADGPCSIHLARPGRSHVGAVRTVTSRASRVLSRSPVTNHHTGSCSNAR